MVFNINLCTNHYSTIFINIATIIMLCIISYCKKLWCTARSVLVFTQHEYIKTKQNHKTNFEFQFFKAARRITCYRTTATTSPTSCRSSCAVPPYPSTYLTCPTRYYRATLAPRCTPSSPSSRRALAPLLTNSRSVDAVRILTGSTRRLKRPGQTITIIWTARSRIGADL